MTWPFFSRLMVMDSGRAPSWLPLSFQVLEPLTETTSVSWVLVMVKPSAWLPEMTVV